MLIMTLTYSQMDCEDDFFFPFQKMNPLEAFEIENRHYEVLIPIKSKKKY